MSNHGFHVHGPHDHELEHAAEHDRKGMAGHLAAVAAIVATVGAIFAYMGGLAEAEAGLFKGTERFERMRHSTNLNNSVVCFAEESITTSPEGVPMTVKQRSGDRRCP